MAIVRSGFHVDRLVSIKEKPYEICVHRRNATATQDAQRPDRRAHGVAGRLDWRQCQNSSKEEAVVLEELAAGKGGQSW
jgi:hypothetical protein